MICLDSHNSFLFHHPLPLPSSPERTNGPRCQQERKRGRPAGSDTLQMAPYYPGVTITVLLQCSVEEATCGEGRKRMDTSQLQNKERWYVESSASGPLSNRLVCFIESNRIYLLSLNKNSKTGFPTSLLISVQSHITTQQKIVYIYVFFEARNMISLLNVVYQHLNDLVMQSATEL